MTVFLLGTFGLLTFGCNGADDGGQTENQLITVERGNLMIDITASGNLALSLTADPAFEIVGNVAEVLVEEGDSVVEGQVLARLDTTSLEQTVTVKEQAEETARLSFQTAEIDLVKAEDDVWANIIAAEIDLEKATDDYRKITYPYTYITWTLDIPESTASIKNARRKVEEALAIIETMELNLGGYNLDTELQPEVLLGLMSALEDLNRASDTLGRGTGSDLFASEILPISSYWTVKAAQQTMEKSQATLQKVKDTAKTSVDKTAVALEKARVALEKAGDELDIAREELEKAVVMAPFDGFITMVNVAGGDEVKKGTIVAQLADPSMFEADILVGEMDIVQVEMGGQALVQVDAVPGLTLPAKVTHISPTATIQSGVVNYQVKVEVQPLNAAMSKMQPVRQPLKPDVSTGEIPERLRQAIEEGRISQEQLEGMMQRWQSGEGPGLSPGSSPMAPGEPQAKAISADFQLKEGLTVTVSIVVDERNDVLLVPNQAITHEGDRNLVQLVINGVIESHPIEVGISDWQFTEVTGGLSEGDSVAVAGTTASTPADSSSSSSSRGFRIPGMGRSR